MPLERAAIDPEIPLFYDGTAPNGVVYITPESFPVRPLFKGAQESDRRK